MGYLKRDLQIRAINPWQHNKILEVFPVVRVKIFKYFHIKNGKHTCISQRENHC